MKEKFVKVTWEDAKKGTDESLHEVMRKKISELIVMRDTYGLLIKDDNDGVVLVHDKCSDDTIEYDVIPRGIIHNIEILKNGVKE